MTAIFCFYISKLRKLCNKSSFYINDTFANVFANWIIGLPFQFFPLFLAKGLSTCNVIKTLHEFDFNQLLKLISTFSSLRKPKLNGLNGMACKEKWMDGKKIVLCIESDKLQESLNQGTIILQNFE